MSKDVKNLMSPLHASNGTIGFDAICWQKKCGNSLTGTLILVYKFGLNNVTFVLITLSYSMWDFIIRETLISVG
jgi:hypothetical protein